MINLTFAGMNQMNHGLPYIMFILMVVTAVAQVRYVLICTPKIIYISVKILMYNVDVYLDLTCSHLFRISLPDF